MNTRVTMIPAWVDGTLTPVEKVEVHRRGLRHKAISVFVLRADGTTLLQRRALGKYHTPGLWANTCCTHPYWDEPPEACATRRLREELGITGLKLRAVRDLEYRADVGDGLIEHECVRMFVADAPVDLPMTLNPDEVCDARWIRFDALAIEIAQTPQRFTPWLQIYMRDHADVVVA
ncbi:MAG: isopentenyl-diphosphate Delta-isomerase [Rhodobacteraceae bacterium]|jgi:isopentenyl-diphosphate delta-isomerase|nr:isopentenyl-diphosphate Delta-isomerase [Paracoccaceae bacterium]